MISNVEDCPIDLCRKKIVVGSVLGIYGLNYPISFWYVYGFSGDNITLISLDPNYQLIIDNPKIIQTDLSMVHYFQVQGIEPPTIPPNFIQHFYRNRYLSRKPKYGDIVLLETQFFTQRPYFILNFDPIANVHLALDISYNKLSFVPRSIDLNLAFCIYKVVSTKEMRKDIYLRAREYSNRLETKNYEPIRIFDEMICFTAQMNYLYEKTEQSNIKLRELTFVGDLENIQNELEELEPNTNTNYDMTNYDYFNYESLTQEDTIIYNAEDYYCSEYNNDLEDNILNFDKLYDEADFIYSTYSPADEGPNETIDFIDYCKTYNTPIEQPTASPILYYDPWLTQSICQLPSNIFPKCEDDIETSETDGQYLNRILNELNNKPVIRTDETADGTSYSSDSSFTPEDWYRKQIDLTISDETYESSSEDSIMSNDYTKNNYECIIETSCSSDDDDDIYTAPNPYYYDTSITVSSNSVDDNPNKPDLETNSPSNSEEVNMIDNQIQTTLTNETKQEVENHEEYDTINPDEIEPYHQERCSIM